MATTPKRFLYLPLSSIIALLVACGAYENESEKTFSSFTQEVESGLPVTECVSAPMAGYYTGDGCLEYKETNPSFDSKRHAGDDFCAPGGTPVYAVAPGKVVFARAWGTCPNWGHLVTVEHRLSDGTSAVSLYGHTIPGVSEGSLVAQGSQVGTVAHYSCWRDHLHFGIAYRDWGGPIGTYPAWVQGYFPHGAAEAPYTKPIDFLNKYRDCPPRVGGLTYWRPSSTTRQVLLNYSDPEFTSPVTRRINYLYYKRYYGWVSGSDDFSLYSGYSGSGTYSWIGPYDGPGGIKFWTEWRDGGGNYVRYPLTGQIEVTD